MNKSDIMKAAEEAVETRKLAFKYGGNPSIVINLKGENVLEALIAAAELLKQVEVLPEGELPQENDLVISKTNTHFSTPFWVDSISESGYVKSYMGARCFNASASEFQIILRAGKPVIIEKEGV